MAGSMGWDWLRATSVSDGLQRVALVNDPAGLNVEVYGFALVVNLDDVALKNENWFPVALSELIPDPVEVQNAVEPLASGDSWPTCQRQRDEIIVAGLPRDSVTVQPNSVAIG